METVFLKILNMSITATWLALAVIVLRLLLNKAPKFLIVILWGFVAVRLCFPFSIESIFSLIPSAEPIPESIIFSQKAEIQSSVPAVGNAVNAHLSGPLAPSPEVSANPMQVLFFVASVVWVFGIVAMLGYTLLSFLQIRKRVGESEWLNENIWICDCIDTPFILGIFDPQIYLPSAMDEQDVAYVIAHEQAHLKRRDHLWKPFGFLLLSVHWFNPVLWIAYVLLCRDIESACDEKVIQEKGTGIKIAYSEALVNCSVPRKSISACPLAFGEVAVRQRVKSVLNYKKPAFWIIFVAFISLIVTAVCLLTNPKENIAAKEKDDNDNKTVQIVDKAEFGDPFRNIIDKATFDVDKDGKEEDCYLGYGPTSGSLTYKIYVSENGKGEYFDIFNVGTFFQNFIVVDGEWKVQGIDNDENPETHYFDIFIRDNNVVLSEDGKELEYWGEHDVDSDAVDWEWAETEIPNVDHPVIVSSDGESIEPYMHFAYSGEWEGSGFLCADGIDLEFELPGLVKKGAIPTITRSAGSELHITLALDRTFQCFYMFDENFEPTGLLYEPDALSSLAAGEYYVGIMFDQKGEYIEQVGMQEYWGWIGVFHLNVE